MGREHDGATRAVAAGQHLEQDEHDGTTRAVAAGQHLEQDAAE